MQRMGPGFYGTVFQPAIRQAWEEGKRYEEIRDTLRVALEPLAISTPSGEQSCVVTWAIEKGSWWELRRWVR